MSDNVKPAALLVLLMGLVVACNVVAPTPTEERVPTTKASAQAENETAYELATLVKLENREPLETDGLHNVFVLSPNVTSGSEPHGEAAFARLGELGIKTIISVDGKAPEVETAARHGMRYVHIPIQYKGIDDEALVRITKSYRELNGPFYVHCFHGRHRGPAAAAVGRIVLDGATRKTAIAEMRQWFGTSPNYEGLYRQINSGKIPSSLETERLAWSFPAVNPVEGIAGAMVPVARAHDALKKLAKNDFAVSAEHPDLDPINEATILLNAFEDMMKLDEVRFGPEEQLNGTRKSVEIMRTLRSEIMALRVGREEAAIAAQRALKALKKECNACHRSFRNN